MIISVTERGEYKRCRRRWHLGSRNRLGLTPIVPATALALGTYVHHALGVWLEHPEISPKRAFLEAARDAKTQAIETYRTQVGANISDSELNNIDEAILQGAFMCENYERHWKEPLPPDFTIIAQEQRITVPIPGSEHTSEWLWDAGTACAVLHQYPDVRLHYLEGRLDGIIKDKRDRLYVLERKTYNIRPREEVLRSTDQFLAYTWMLKQLDFGYRVAGVAYDGLWKRVAVPKTVDGRGGTLADLFLRMRIERAPEELIEFEEELAHEALEMASDPFITKHRTSDGSCFWGCSYEPLCAAISRGEDVDYVKRTRYTAKQGDASSSEVAEVA